ncbi:MAG: YlbF family regulator [Syntrophomonas sp.]|nr:YlbF family regulator [Syntrophomonas sp.]
MENINPYDKAHELAQAIRDSDVFKHYLAAQKELEENPEAVEKVRLFHLLRMEANQARVLGQEQEENKVTEMTLEFAKLSQDKAIADYFNAEGSFVQMFSEIQEIIQKSMENGFSE